MTVIPIRPVPVPDPGQCPTWCHVNHDDRDPGWHESPYADAGGGVLAKLMREAGPRTVVTMVRDDEYEDYSLAAAFLAGGPLRRLALRGFRR